MASNKARNLFKRFAGPSCMSGEVVRILTDLIEHGLSAVPSGVDIYDRRGKLRMHLPGKARFGPGVTCLCYQDPAIDAVVPFGRGEIQTAARLADTLSSFDFVSTPGILKEGSVQRSYTAAFQDGLLHQSDFSAPVDGGLAGARPTQGRKRFKGVYRRVDR